MTQGNPPDVAGLEARGPLLVGVITALALVLGFGLWAATVPIEGAVLAAGEVDTTAQSHLVQHADGGTVAEVAVREGQAVVAGDLLLRLEGGALDQEWALVSAQLVEARARSLRLTAERNGEMLHPPTSQTPFQLAVADQYRLFLARRETLQRQVEQLQQRRRQTEAQLAGLADQDQAMALEAALLETDLATQRELHERGLTQATRVAALAREAARIAGARAGISARIAGLHGELAEIDLQIETLRAARHEEAEAQLTEVGALLVELTSRRAFLSNLRARLTMRAAVSGTVYGLSVLGPGTVLRPAETAMQIVTRDVSPRLALRVRPEDIDHVYVGQAATVQFPALAGDVRDLTASVTGISPAPFVDERSGTRHYRVEAELTPEAQAVVRDRALLPGLAVQAFLTTGARTPLAYLVAPITEQIQRAMRQP